MRDLVRAGFVFGLYLATAVLLLAAAVALLGIAICVLGIPLLCFWTLRYQCRRLCRPGPWTKVAIVAAGVTSLVSALALAHAARWPWVAIVILAPAIFLVMGNLILLTSMYLVLHPHLMTRLVAAHRLRAARRLESALRRASRASQSAADRTERAYDWGFRAWQRREKWLHKILAKDPRGLARPKASAEKQYASMSLREIRAATSTEAQRDRQPLLASLRITVGELEICRRTFGPARERCLEHQDQVSRFSADLAATEHHARSLRDDYEKAVNRFQVAAAPRIRLP
jgi:hypothetical protein